MTDDSLKHIIEFFKDLDLLAPADPASTRRALEYLCIDEQALIVDAGCGTGRQTRQLLKETQAHVIATDLELNLLTGLRELPASHGGAERLEVVQAHMLALPFRDASIDVIYSEGAVYNVGIEVALKAWLPLLQPGGYVCFSDAAYKTAEVPGPVREFWESEYPGITTLEHYRNLVTRSGFEIIADFWMPDSGWDAYYNPIAERIERLAPVWSGDKNATAVLKSLRDEVDLYRTYGDTYGYVFLVLRKPFP